MAPSPGRGEGWGQGGNAQKYLDMDQAWSQFRKLADKISNLRAIA